jgi:hypothetical protein
MTFYVTVARFFRVIVSIIPQVIQVSLKLLAGRQPANQQEDMVAKVARVIALSILDVADDIKRISAPQPV